uniref:NodB homology domain-containing protein n=1 Tax=Alexandrium catenella TaxID=2925 RepID=A0A7S1M5Q7_ALECA|mmetsp:Transcript_20477/g.55898  ORF Transcript_20477/g.55898 Transcript_20477/m.55898 type:complete len:306 (+) Transcript_20477:104-1021(+)
MKTTRVIVAKTVSSPLLLSCAVGSIVGTSALLFGAAATEHVIDDLAVFLVLLLVASLAYLQSDWALAYLERFSPDVVWRIPTRQKMAALTIDDVPLLEQPTSLEEILDVLKEHEVTATLFVMSGFDLAPEKGGMKPEARKRCRELLQRAVAEGHEFGNHLQFDFPAIAMEPPAFDAAFGHCDRLLAELAGGEQAWRDRPRRWFRPASAMWNSHILRRAREKGYTTVIANCYPHDVASVTRRLNARYLKWRVRPGAVVIVHDRWHTPETLRQALPYIKSQGLRLGTLSALQAAADSDATAQGGATE